MTEPFLEINHLTRTFGTLKAVDGVDLAVQSGEIFGLLGPNGAGKTTTIQMICGLLAPDSGSIRLGGQPVRNGEAKVMRRIGVCTQQNILWEKLTCAEQLEFAGQMYHLPASQSRTRCDELLEQLGLSEKRNQLASKLSGGMQRRLNLALGLVHDPDLVVLDEPEAGLDPQSRVMVREFIHSLARRKTVLLTTHNMDEAERLCDRLAILDHGRVLCVDTPAELIRTVGEGDVLELECEMELSPQLTGEFERIGLRIGRVNHTWVVRGRALVEKMAPIFDLFRANSVNASQMHLRANTLEDVFISLTGRRLRE